MSGALRRILVKKNPNGGTARFDDARGYGPIRQCATTSASLVPKLQSRRKVLFCRVDPSCYSGPRPVSESAWRSWLCQMNVGRRIEGVGRVEGVGSEYCNIERLDTIENRVHALR